MQFIVTPRLGDLAGPPARPVAGAPLVSTVRTHPGSYRSRDGRWVFDHEDSSGTPWVTTYMPTRQLAVFGSLTDARRAAASGELRARFHDEDLAVLARPCTRGCGHKSVAIVNTSNGPRPVCKEHRDEGEAHGFTTRLPVNPNSPVHTRCGFCSRGLVYVGNEGRMQHVDACRACIDGDVVLPLCPEPDTHLAEMAIVCTTPDPVQCPHIGCVEGVYLAAGECPRGRGECCGCCQTND